MRQFKSSEGGQSVTDPKPKISDNPSTRDIAAALPLVQFLGAAAGFVAKLGFKSEKLAEFKRLTDDLTTKADILDLPDKFNNAFADLGWVATGAMSVDVMRTAVALHAEGKVAEAEAVIVDWFDQDTIRLFAITRAQRFHVADLRDAQLEEALKLYIEGRYMAAVPLILIACDGFASDVSGVSPFEKNADLTSFDSIVGHPTSLPALMALFTLGVRKSSNETLTIPKRHGILHGRSLGYANKIVAAKAWMLMVALVDWAGTKKSEQERIQVSRKASETTFMDTIRLYQKTQKDREALDAFSPVTTVGAFPESIGKDTPEFAVREFLEGWKAGNFGLMGAHAMNLVEKSTAKMAGSMRSLSEGVQLQGYEIVHSRLSTTARFEVRAKIEATVQGQTVSGYFDILTFKNRPTGQIAMPSDTDGIWMVQPIVVDNVRRGKVALDQAEIDEN